MEFPFSYIEESLGYWPTPGIQMDNFGQFDDEVRIPVSVDHFGNFADLMNFDVAGLYSSGSVSDQIFSSSMLPNCTPATYGSIDALDFADQGTSTFSNCFGVLGSSYVLGDRSILQPSSPQITYPIDLSNENDPQRNEDSAFIARCLVQQNEQLLLDNLSCTMQKTCKSDAEICGEEGSKTRNAVVYDSNLDCIASTQIADGLNSNGLYEQVADRSKRRVKTVSLSVLQQYFSGSLKDAANSIGVSPTTLKKICRQHGISKWPSRKISKVNRSLRKIRTVLDSVQCVEGALKFDPTECGFLTLGEASNSQDTPIPLVLSENINTENFLIDLENDIAFVAELLKPATPLEPTNNLSSIPFPSSNPTGHTGEKSSSKTDSNGSGLIMHGSSSSSQSLDEGKQVSKPEWKITVKATYRDDTVRFKFKPGYGLCRLCDEVAKRFRIQNRMFELKYLDDEEEWMMLAGDSDLQECFKIMEDSGMRSMKFLVRDSLFSMGSSGFLMGGF